MAARIVAGTANPGLAEAVASVLGAKGVGTEVERFPDGELRPALEGVRGDDVYVVQPTGPPVSEHLVVVVDPHTVALEAMCSIPVEMLTAVPVLAGAVTPFLVGEAVLVAPDLGAVKLAERFAARQRGAVAVVRKHRLSGTEVQAEELVGDVAGRAVIVVDDMISTGGTIEAAVDVLLAHGARPEVAVLATHGLFVGDAADRLAAMPVHRVIVTDTMPPRALPGVPLEVSSVAPLLADAIRRLHENESLDDLLVRT